MCEPVWFQSGRSNCEDNGFKEEGKDSSPKK